MLQRRKWLQVHLSTMLIVTLIIAVFLWPNCIVSTHFKIARLERTTTIENGWVDAKCGWPFTYAESWLHDFWSDEDQQNAKAQFESSADSFIRHYNRRSVFTCKDDLIWRTPMLILNIAVALTLVGGAVLGLEHIARKKENPIALK